MIHYRDRTYCNAGVLCKSFDCTRRLQQHELVEAREKNLPVCFLDFTTAKCFVPWFTPDTIQHSKISKVYGKSKPIVCRKKTRKAAKRTSSGKKRTGRGVMCHY